MGKEKILPNLGSIRPSQLPDKKIIVLKESVKPLDAKDLMEKKKTSFFGSALKRPNPAEVTVQLPQLIYEQIVFISGKYDVDFYRKASYKLQVAKDIKDVIIGEETFPVVSEYGVWKKFGKKMKKGVGVHKQDLVIEGDEHVVRTIEDSLYIDNYGQETKFTHKISHDSVETYPKRILDVHKDFLKKVELTEEAIIQKLAQKLVAYLDFDIRLNSQKFTVDEYHEIYLPVYEARAHDMKKRAAIIRVDGVTGKVL